ncbi:hypothetical protein P8452_59104 [Trifolium repens]|nr:hypothetical protein QL285_036171 [Trifolium repens]WJX75584.1 hypothetical protein P8452_59104 [Trifolium repens]
MNEPLPRHNSSPRVIVKRTGKERPWQNTTNFHRTVTPSRQTPQICRRHSVVARLGRPPQTTSVNSFNGHLQHSVARIIPVDLL